MTRQPTIQLGIHLPMTADAKPHLKFYGTQAIHGLHLPMALRAVQTGPFDVGNVIEINEIRHPIDPHPGYRLFGFIVLPLFPDLRVLGDNVLMAVETFFHGRNPGIRRSFRIRMAVPAVDLLYPGMNSMAEIDGLLRAKPLSRKAVIEIEHGHEK